MHNFNISAEERKLFLSWLSEDLVHARDRPTDFVVDLLGDFNFLPPGESRHKLKNPGSEKSQPRQLDNANSPLAKALCKMVSFMTAFTMALTPTLTLRAIPPLGSTGS